MTDQRFAAKVNACAAREIGAQRSINLHVGEGEDEGVFLKRVFALAVQMVICPSPST